MRECYENHSERMPWRSNHGSLWSRKQRPVPALFRYQLYKTFCSVKSQTMECVEVLRRELVLRNPT